MPSCNRARSTRADAALAHSRARRCIGGLCVAECSLPREPTGFEWLELAYDERDGGLPDIKGDRMFRTLVNDPRYKAFLRKMKLPE